MEAPHDHFTLDGMPMDVVNPPRFGGGVSCPEADSNPNPGRRTTNKSPAAILEGMFMDILEEVRVAHPIYVAPVP